MAGITLAPHRHSPPDTHIPIWPWLQRPPPPPAFEAGLASLPPGPRFGAFVGHSHLFRPQPFPGAPAFAYEGLGLVEFSPIGPSVSNRCQLRVLQPPTSFASLGLKTQGLGGLSQGQFVTVPLAVAPEWAADNAGGENLYGDFANWVG
jgi:hypothetical protein